MLGLLTLIKPLYGRLIKACQTHLYHLEGSSPQEMDCSEVGKRLRDQCPLVQASEGLTLPMLHVGGWDSRNGSFILFSRLTLDQIQRATEKRNKRLVSSEKDVETDVVCLLFLEPPLRQLPLPALNLLCAVNSDLPLLLKEAQGTLDSTNHIETQLPRNKQRWSGGEMGAH